MVNTIDICTIQTQNYSAISETVPIYLPQWYMYVPTYLSYSQFIMCVIEKSWILQKSKVEQYAILNMYVCNILLYISVC